MSVEKKDEYYFAKKFGISPSEFLDFSSYVNPNPPPDFTWVIIEASSELFRNPDATCEELKRRISNYWGIKEGNLLLSNSFSGIIRLAINAMDLRKVIVAEIHADYVPDFKISGCEIIKWSGEISELPLNNLEEFQAVILSNPSIESGRLKNRDELSELLNKLFDIGAYLIVDERLIELSNPSQSLSSKVSKFENLLVLNSLSNSFGILGLPLGYAIASEELIEELEKIKPIELIDVLTQAIARYLFENPSEYFEESRRIIEEEKRWLKFSLESLSIKVFDSDANFLLLDPSSLGLSPSELTEALAREGILVRESGDLIGLGVRKREENTKLITSLEKIVNRPENLSNKWFRDLERREEPIGPRTSCPYYPCHFESQDCTFCFCPFYPCENEAFGDYLEKENRKIWSCLRCSVVHESEVAKELFRMMKEGKTKEEMWEWLLSQT